ncbi:MAG: VWA domain-containing protein [Planctomycetes bacterium]|nr:VWA domain-containing protein [Planctomycetota bacterium]
MPTLAMTASPAAHPRPPLTGGRLVASDGRALPLEGVHLAAEAGGGVARVVLTQRFRNDAAHPLEVRYLLPLPADGAVSGFSFVLGDERVVGEVAGREAARERYEQALVEGRTAALLDQERSSTFTQRLGNVPPGATIVAEVTIDQPLRWLEEGAWEWRFPTVVCPRYHGAPGVVPDAAALDVPVAEGGLDARATLTLAIADRLTGPVDSVTHRIVVDDGRVRLDRGARLDRDVVVTWPVALPDVSAGVLAARPATAAHDGDAFALLTVAPPTGGWTPVPRDLTFLLDTSGSMSGQPLEQARRVAAAMIATLGVNDRLELIAFGSRPTRWKDDPTPATESSRRAALAWLDGLRASGGTEMHGALLEALRPLRPGSQRQVVLVTDGQIGFEQEIVRACLERLPAGARLHTVGVGGAVNRSLTRAAARAGRGVELIVGLGEDASKVAERLVARTAAPLVTDLEVTGDAVVQVAPATLPDLFAEAPALIALRVRGGGGEVVLRGTTADGPIERRLALPALARGEGPTGVAALFARERVEDLETALAAGGDPAELDRAVEATGLEFQVATRLTSWVAVSARVTVEPGAPRVTVEQPHELPHGVSAEGLGLRGALLRGAFTGKVLDGSSVLLAGLEADSIVRRMTTKRLIPPPGEGPSLTKAGFFDPGAMNLTRDGAMIGPEARAAWEAERAQREREAPRHGRSRRGWLGLVVALLAVLLALLALWRAGAFAAPTNQAPEGVGPR